jgi:hypothetical protein
MRPAAKLAIALQFVLGCSGMAHAAPADVAAERFAHLYGINLADGFTLDDVAEALGASPVVESGDASTYEARVCYRTSDGAAVIEFFHGELDWGFTVREPEPADSRCPRTSAPTRGPIEIAGVALGMERTAYEGATGVPKTVTRQRVTHNFEYVRTLTDEELRKFVERSERNGYPPGDPEQWRHWGVSIALVARFRRGRLVSFTVDRSESN